MRRPLFALKSCCSLSRLLVDKDANQAVAAGSSCSYCSRKERHDGMTSGVPVLPVQAINELKCPHNPAQYNWVFWLVLIRNYYDSLWRVFMDVVLWFCGYNSRFSFLQMEIMDFSNQAFYWWPNIKGKHTFPCRIYGCWFKDFSIKMSEYYLVFFGYILLICVLTSSQNFPRMFKQRILTSQQCLFLIWSSFWRESELMEENIHE